MLKIFFSQNKMVKERIKIFIFQIRDITHLSFQLEKFDAVATL